MTDTKTAQAWVDGYLKAWRSNDPDDIRALFTEDAAYRPRPFDDPRVGHDAIVAGWLEDQDQPDDFTYAVTGSGIRIAGDEAFIEGATDYTDGRWVNLWVVAFARDGRATSFTDWYMKRHEPS